MSLIDIPATILKAYGVSPINRRMDGLPLDEPRTSARIEYSDDESYEESRRIRSTAIATPGLVSVTYDGGLKDEVRY